MKAWAASPTKLRDGSWGARVRSQDVQVGAAVEITTAAGKSWTATVTRVLWRGDGVAICATQSATQSSKARGDAGRGRRYECDECGEWVSPGTSCWETGCAH